MVFSMRAECSVDFNRFMELAKNTHGLVLKHKVRPDPDGLPDVEIEFASDCALAQIAEVPDGRTMLQTLRPVPLADNSLERDYDIH